MAKTRVLVVDDQLVVRQLFEMYLKSSDKYELVEAPAVCRSGGGIYPFPSGG